MMKSYFIIMMFLIFLLMMSVYNCFLTFLICMEFFVLLNLLVLIICEMENFSWMFMFYLMFSVCEAVIGLSLMVSMLSIVGSQGFLTMNLKC